MALINDFLTTTSDLSSKFCLAIHATLTIGKKTLDKYHNKTGESDVYRIAMGKFRLVSMYIIYSNCNSSHIQSFTLSTNWSFSRNKTGMHCQLRKHAMLFKTNLTERTGCWMLRGMIAHPNQMGTLQ